MSNERTPPVSDIPGIRSAAQILDDMASREALPVCHPDHPNGFLFNGDHVILHWGTAHPYEIPLSPIRTSHDLFSWVHHLMGKTWVTDMRRLRRLIDAVAERKNLPPFQI